MSRKMKDSGIEWIGEIPEEWKTIRMKSCFSQRDSGAWGSEPNGTFGDEICLRIADFDYSRFRFKDRNIGEYTIRHYDKKAVESLILQKNDIIIEKSGGGDKTPVGRTVIFDKEFRALYANFCDRLRCRKYVCPDFMQYEFVTFYLNGFVWNYIKQTTGIQNLDLTSMLATERIAFPSFNEQTAIASYLDRQCAHIDNIIEKTKASIEEYKKLKQAVITQAVTKGIRGDRPMKDSGIEWIGEIPEEWEVTRMKYCAELSPKCNLLSLHEKSIVEYLPMEYVKNRSYIHNTALYGSIPHSLTQFQNGDIIFAKVTPCFENGNIAIPSNMPSGIGFGSSELYVLRTIKILKNYLFYWIQNSLFVNEACATMTGTGGLKRVSSAFVRNSYLPYPSAAEQSEIAAYLDKKCDEIDAIITKKQQFITEMESYKKSMIYEYVTGKKEAPKAENRVEFSTEFKIALVMCIILQNTEIKGRTHMQKVVFSSDILLNLFDLQYYRFPHGPYDVNIEKYEQVLSQNGWVDIEKSNGSICYKKTERFDDFTDYYQQLFSDKDNDIKKICQAFNVHRTAKAEKMATVLASWNDFLIDGVTPTDEMIVNDIVTNWTENKANIDKSTWYDTISKLKEQGLIPKGFGKKTLSEEAAKNVY